MFVYSQKSTNYKKIIFYITYRDIQLKHTGGGTEQVTWSESEMASASAISLTPTGDVSVRGTGQLGVRVHLTQYPHVWASGR